MCKGSSGKFQLDCGWKDFILEFDFGKYVKKYQKVWIFG